jgi:hypothetical protein
VLEIREPDARVVEGSHDVRLSSGQAFPTITHSQSLTVCRRTVWMTMWRTLARLSVAVLIETRGAARG